MDLDGGVQSHIRTPPPGSSTLQLPLPVPVEFTSALAGKGASGVLLFFSYFLP